MSAQRHVACCVQEDPAFQQGGVLLRLLWNREWAQVWPALAQPWPEELAPAATKLKAVLRERALGYIRKGYSVISVTNASTLLGVSPEELAAGATLQA